MKRSTRYTIVAAMLTLTIILGMRVLDLKAIASLRETFQWRGFLFYSFASILLSYLIKSLRFFVYLRTHIKQDWRSFSEILVISNALFGFAALTPAQLGDFLKVEYVNKRFGVNRLTLYNIFFQEKALDFASIIAIGLITIASNGLSAELKLGSLPHVTLAMSIGIVLAVVMTLGLYWLKRDLVVWALGVVDWSGLIATVPLTIMFWLTVIWGWQGIWAVHGVHADWSATGFAMAGSTLVSAASLIPGAIGISEVTITTALILCGFSPSEGSVASILARGYTIAIVANGILFSPLAWYLLRTVSKTPAEPMHND